MDDAAKRFARRILAVHGLLLLLVLATVAAAAAEIYHSTREQMLNQAEDRQKTLAKQTASGIESHYQSILNDIDLLRRAENDETGAEKPTTEPAAPEPPAVVPLTPEQRAERAAAPRVGPATTALWSASHVARRGFKPVQSDRHALVDHRHGDLEAGLRPGVVAVHNEPSRARQPGC